MLMTALAAVTWLPAMLLLFLVPAFAGNMTFLSEHLCSPVHLGIFARPDYAVAFLMLALSSLSKSRWFVAVMYAGLTLFTHAVFGVIGAATQGSMFSWVSIFANVDQVGDVLFRLPPRYDTHPLVSAAAHRAIVAGSMVVLSRRIRAVEVVT